MNAGEKVTNVGIGVMNAIEGWGDGLLKCWRNGELKEGIWLYEEKDSMDSW
jgi:hypothetical protein